MQTKHTPGPWKSTGHVIASESKILIASLSGASDDDTEAANARLIAAAPDLLAALDLIAKSEEIDGDTFVCDFSTLQSVARAAITKATNNN